MHDHRRIKQRLEAWIENIKALSESLKVCQSCLLPLVTTRAKVVHVDQSVPGLGTVTRKRPHECVIIGIGRHKRLSMKNS